MNDTRSHIGILILRLGLGAMFLAHGLLKALVFSFAGTAAFFAAHGFPGWTAYPVATLEIIGGVLLMAGIATRWVSVALIPVLLGAIYVHLGNGWVFSNANGGWEYPLFLLATTVVLVLAGPGRYTLRFQSKA